MKKNIIFPIEFNFLKGGMIHSVSSLINFLKNDYNVYILAHKDAEIFQQIKDVNHLKLKHNWSISVFNLLKTLRTYTEVKKITKNFPKESTLVLTNNVGSELIFSGFGIKKNNLNRFFVSRGGNYEGKTGFFLKLGFKSVNKFIAISNRQVKILKQNGIEEDKISLIHNGVEANKFGYLENKKELKNIAIVGFLHPLKNQLLAFYAIRKLKDLNYNFTLNVYGEASSNIDVEYKKILDKYIKDNELEDNIIYKGYEENRDEIYLNNEVLLSCSLSEGFGRTIVEAMAYSLPCIGLYESGGLLDIIENNENGILINNSVHELVEVLIKLHDNYEFRKQIEKNAFNTFESKFTDKIMSEKYKILIDSFFKTI